MIASREASMDLGVKSVGRPATGQVQSVGRPATGQGSTDKVPFYSSDEGCQAEQAADSDDWKSNRQSYSCILVFLYPIEDT